MTSRGICQSVGMSLRKGEHFPFWTKTVRTKIKPDFRARDTYSCRCLPGFEPTYLPAPLLSVGDGSPAKPRLVYCNPVMTNGTKAEAASSASGSSGSSSIYLNDNAANTNFTIHYFPGTVTYTESGTTPMLNWDSRYLCHFSTEMAEIWSPSTFFVDVWTYKISALYLLYFQSYESFCGVFSDFH